MNKPLLDPGRQIQMITNVECSRLLKASHLKQVLPDLFQNNSNDYSKVLEVYIEILISNVKIKANENKEFQAIVARKRYTIDVDGLIKDCVLSNFAWIQEKFKKAGFEKSQAPPKPVNFYNWIWSVVV